MNKFKIKPSDRVTVLTGSGISKASGIATFREDDGVWTKYDVDHVCTANGCQEYKTEAWEFFKDTYADMNNTCPNEAHYALVKLERFLNKGNFTLITQNIDGLHQMAGSENVIEMHGNNKKMICGSPRCGNIEFPIEEMIDKEEYVVCPKCGNMLRPDVVMFGETPRFMDLIKESLDCDYFISIGTSGMVHPAAGLAMKAWQKNAIVINICYNSRMGEYSEDNFHCFDAKAEEFLPKFIDDMIQ